MHGLGIIQVGKTWYAYGAETYANTSFVAVTVFPESTIPVIRVRTRRRHRRLCPGRP
jgi:hypothetical protein